MMTDCDYFTAALQSRSRAQGCMWLFVWEMVLIRAKRRYIFWCSLKDVGTLHCPAADPQHMLRKLRREYRSGPLSFWIVRDDPCTLAWTLAFSWYTKRDTMCIDADLIILEFENIIFTPSNTLCCKQPIHYSRDSFPGLITSQGKSLTVFEQQVWLEIKGVADMLGVFRWGRLTWLVSANCTLSLSGLKSFPVAEGAGARVRLWLNSCACVRWEEKKEEELGVKRQEKQPEGIQMEWSMSRVIMAEQVMWEWKWKAK